MINIKIDSRKIVKGDIFVCIKGHTVDGHDYVDVAIKNGAVKIISEREMDIDVSLEVVDSTEVWLEKYLIDNYSATINQMKLIGVTGTNGKTTTCYLVYQMLNFLSLRTAYIGTIGFHTLENEIEVDNTTPNILDLYSMLLEAKENDYKCVVMEVSSHALSLGRVNGLNFCAGAFTNLTQDHLDYHNTMDEYKKAKLLLTSKLTNDASMIVNVDVPDHEDFLVKNSKSLGIKGNDYKINNYKMTINGTDINFVVNKCEYTLRTNLTAIFNVYNYMTALALCNSLGYSIDEIIAISGLVNPPIGRAQIIKVNGGIAVVDYAHTPDAVEKIIMSFKEIEHKKIVTIVGCGGDRDPKKRPIMGEVATRESDYVIFSNDNPRTEDPNKIMEDIIGGVTSDNYQIIFDRKEAIKKALDMLGENDILLLLGKGHEEYQIVGHTKMHLSDIEEVEKYLENQ